MFILHIASDYYGVARNSCTVHITHSILLVFYWYFCAANCDVFC